ncbi:hypothetical protein J2129_001122 [Methanofollis sp. W23]|nr:hypothetical protein [Methanofollis sp. W23]
MTLSQHTRKKIAIACILICIGTICAYLAYGALTGRTPWHDQPENKTQETMFRCFIIEYNQSFTKDALVFHLTDADLEDYPEYKRGMEEANFSTMEWRDGKRFIYEVKDFSDEHLWSFNLCPENYSRSECFSHLRLYEYKGRYFEIRCIPSLMRNR